jgi:hypothetical protein
MVRRVGASYTVESVVDGGSFNGGWRTDLVSVVLPFGRRDHVSS